MKRPPSQHVKSDDTKSIATHLHRAHMAMDTIARCERWLTPHLIRSVSKRPAVCSVATTAFPSDAQRIPTPSDVEEAVAYPANFSVTIGRRIKTRRVQRGLTQAALAKRTGIKRPNIARLERGTNYPNLTTLIAICEGLSTTLDTILATTD